MDCKSIIKVACPRVASFSPFTRQYTIYRGLLLFFLSFSLLIIFRFFFPILFQPIRPSLSNPRNIHTIPSYSPHRPPSSNSSLALLRLSRESRWPTS